MLSAAWMVLVKPLLSTQDSITVPTKKADLIDALVPAITAQRDTSFNELIKSFEMEGQQDQEGQDDSYSEREQHSHQNMHANIDELNQIN